MLLAPCSAKLSEQSPPCRRKPSPAATRASDFFRLRASPAKTSGGNVASCASTSPRALKSGYSGICSTGLPRQLSGVHRSDITSLLKTALYGCGGRVIHSTDRDRQFEIHIAPQALAAKAEFAFARPVWDTMGETAVSEAALDDAFADDITFQATDGY